VNMTMYANAIAFMGLMERSYFLLHGSREELRVIVLGAERVDCGRLPRHECAGSDVGGTETSVTRVDGLDRESRENGDSEEVFHNVGLSDFGFPFRPASELRVYFLHMQAVEVMVHSFSNIFSTSGKRSEQERARI
jgi:hypothetical protein